ncbi:hypothetical protein, conserved [Babesia ovata]|uniref:DOT1 domain-containing protein n=1 Tax=Babesia ovata TaxID=189622 RepID=A0A2H6K938_9APIC|nr:uncharacterized protein BOVATA_010090 [Babesia ovata]GBE59516.1 hypothetical protein, conserved [Babesia ovata]
MDSLTHGHHMASKRVHSHPEEEDNYSGADCGVDGHITCGGSKRRQVEGQMLADLHKVEPVSEPTDMATGSPSNLVSCSIGDIPQLLSHRRCRSGDTQRTVSSNPCNDPFEEYSQLARSIFRRIYYDLSRGIEVGDNGISYLFKSCINDISTSTYGMYGEIRPACLAKVCEEMVRFGMDERSVVVDLGSGRGAPNFLFAHQVRVFASIGIELCPVSYGLSVHNLMHYLKLDVASGIRELTSFGGVNVGDVLSPISEVLAKKLSSVEPDDTMQTPQRNRLTKDDNDDSASSGERTALGVNDSVVTNYESSSTYGDSTSATPTKDTESSNDDEEAFYRAMHRMSVTPSKLSVAFCNEDISAFDHFEGASHLYSFDIAMEKALVNNIVRQFSNTRSAWLFASFNGDLIERFELKDCFLANRIPCQMYKSGERRFCYIYVKNNWEQLKMEHDAAISEMFGLPLPTNATPPQPEVATTGRKLRPRRSRTPTRGGNAASSDSSDTPLKSAKSMLVSQFDEPVGLIEAVKLAKMPLEAQLGWYAKKIARPQEVVTRSKVVNSTERVRMGLASQRSKLLEMIATSTDPRNTAKYVGMLKRHLQQKYMPTRSFAPPSA